jgi:hypothetical protein
MAFAVQNAQVDEEQGADDESEEDHVRSLGWCPGSGFALRFPACFAAGRVDHERNADA